MQNEITEGINKDYEGKECEVLVEGLSSKDKSKYEGRTSSNKIVHFSAESKLQGKRVPVKISRAAKHFLEGEVICQ